MYEAHLRYRRFPFRSATAMKSIGRQTHPVRITPTFGSNIEDAFQELHIWTLVVVYCAAQNKFKPVFLR
jgi:hypothetical protein